MSLRRRFQKPRRLIVTAAALAALRVLRWLPGRSPIGVCRLLGRAAYYVLWHDRRRALENLERVYGDDLAPAERTRIAKACFSHFGEMVGELLYLERGEKAWQNIKVEIQGLDRLEAVLERGKGAMIATAHMGNWELSGAYSARTGRPITVVALEQTGYPRLQKLLDEHRRRIGLIVHYSRGTGMVSVVRALRQNQRVAILADLRTSGQGFMSPFLGIPAHTQTGVIHLAAKAGAGLLVGYDYRLGSLHHRYVLEETIALEPPIDGAKDRAGWQAMLEKAAMTMNQHFSDAIRAHPEQWMWMHRRFPKPTKRHENTASQGGSA